MDEEEALDNWTDLVKPQRAGTGATTEPWQDGALTILTMWEIQQSTDRLGMVYNIHLILMIQ